MASRFTIYSGFQISGAISRSSVPNQLLQPCTARTAWSDSVTTSETSLITEAADSVDLIKLVSFFFSVNVLPS